MSVGPDTPGLSKAEHEAYNARMREKYGEEAALVAPMTTSSGDGGADKEPSRKENLTYLNAWTEHLEAKDGSGDTMVESDNKIALYESDTEDEQGRKHYFYWHWTSGQSRDQGSYVGNLWNMWNRVRLESGNEMMQYAPDRDLTMNGKTYTVGLSAEYKGVGVSIEGDFTLNQDKVRPHPDHTAVGDNGEFASQWIGDYEGTQGFIGSSEERRPVGNSRDFKYKMYLKGGKYKKTY